MRIVVTGSAGFIGYHTSSQLLAQGHEVLGIDCVNDYYDVGLKETRLLRLKALATAKGTSFTEARIDLADAVALEQAFAAFKPERVINLAAQAGVRYSVENPAAYISSNLVGFANILESCRHHEVGHLVYASTSSVYGANGKLPFAETDGVGHPMSLYAATKRANELMAHSYSHLFKLPTTGLRFFTVYGPWGRPDMALFKFAKAMLAGQAIDVYNGGQMSRDFTYVDDIVEGILRIADTVPVADPNWSVSSPHPEPDRSAVAPFRVFNIGRGEPSPLMDYVRVLERKLGLEAKINFMPMQAGDVEATRADTSALREATGWVPTTSIETGIGHFVDWYRDYFKV